ncbi:MAG: N-acetyltransferase family protein [Thermoanaerobaculia bacterium]
MPSYRFCRPDDIPFLVRAVNECFTVHFPETEPMTGESFRREMKALDLWPSSCMVAVADDEPKAVLTGAKRPEETLVSRIGVRPGEERQGHAGHLLTSLSQKLAVLGPPRLVAEVPAALPGAGAFFQSLGWRREAAFTDRERPATAGAVEPPPEGLVAPATVDELEASGALPGEQAGPEAPPWSRQARTLRNRRDDLRALAVASPDRVEAWLVYDPGGNDAGEGGAVEVLAFGAQDPEHRELLLGALLRQAIRDAGARPVRLARLRDGELPEELLTALGFERREEYHRYSAEAQPL